MRNFHRKLGGETNNPTCIFTEPWGGYRMPKGEGQGAEKQDG